MYASWPQSMHFSGPLWSISTPSAPLRLAAVHDDGHGGSRNGLFSTNFVLDLGSDRS